MKKVSLETIERWLKDGDCDVRVAAMNACNNRTDIPLETIERWLKDGDCDVRAAAMNACNNRTDIPLETIERGLKDGDCDVRAAAMNACKRFGYEIPIIRTIEPPERVYKKCVGGVIVVANIPKDAHIRGCFQGKCQTNKAKIIEVIGKFADENVGISLWDKTTAYYSGDEVYIEDFDMSDEECSTGFHFFCTKEQAENY